MHRHFKSWNDMKHEPRKFWSAKTIVLFMQNYYTISDGESQTPNFPEGKGGEEGGGGVCTQASVLAILWTSPSFAVNVMLAISLSLFLLLFF